jgi:hypothetical protein
LEFAGFEHFQMALFVLHQIDQFPFDRLCIAVQDLAGTVEGDLLIIGQHQRCPLRIAAGGVPDLDQVIFAASSEQAAVGAPVDGGDGNELSVEPPGRVVADVPAIGTDPRRRLIRSPSNRSSFGSSGNVSAEGAMLVATGRQQRPCRRQAAFAMHRKTTRLLLLRCREKK